MSHSLIGLELAILRRDPRSWGALLALAVLILVSFAAIALDAAQSNADMSRFAAAERARWVGQGTKDPHSAAHYSIFAFKPAPPLLPLDSGSTPFVGQTVWLEAHHQNDMLYRPQQNASLLQRAGFASPAALLAGFAPLAVFLIAFTLVAQDRERGTMRLALGAAAHPRKIVQTKVLACWTAATALLVAPAATAGLLWLGWSDTLGADPVLRLLLWTAMMCAYLLLLASLGVAVSLLASNARIALALLIAFWIVLALALPRLASGTADVSQPLPSSQEVRRTLEAEAPAFWSDEQNRKNRQALLARYRVTRLEDIPNPRMAELDMMERHSHRVFDRVLGSFYDQVARQDRMFARLSLLSPTIAVQALSASLAGTDFSHHRDFIDTAEAYRRDLVNRMNADGMAHDAHGTERHVNDAGLWSSIPDFAYSPPHLGAVNANAASAALSLLGWLLATAVLILAAARRLRP